MKLIQNYLEDPKLYYLKNSNTILFFVFKNFLDNLKQYIMQHKTTIKNILFNLIKKNVSSSDERENIVDIVAAFIVKSELFSFEEVSELFNKIFAIWRECDNSISNHIGICLNEVIVKYAELNNLNFVCKFIEANLNHMMNYNSINEEANSEADSVNKYFNLLKNYFSNQKMSDIIVKFLFGYVISLLQATMKSGCNFTVCSVLNKISTIVIEIITEKKNCKYFEGKEAEKIICEFLESMMNNLAISEADYLVKSVFIDLIKLVEVLISVVSHESSINVLNILLEDLNIISKKKESSLYNLEKYSNIHFYLKNINLIINKSNGERQIRTDYSDSYEKVINYVFSLLNQIEAGMINESDENDTMAHRQLSLFNYRKLSELLSVLLYNVKTTSDKICSNMDDEENSFLVNSYSNLKKIYNFVSDKFKNSFENFLNLCGENVSNHKVLLSFRLRFTFISSVLNGFILTNEIKSVDFVSALFDKIFTLENENIFEILFESKLFKLKKNLIEATDKDVIYKILYKLKEYYEINGIGSKRLNSASRFLLHCLLNLYSSFNSAMIDENYDIIIDLTIKTLDLNINIKSSASLMKKILKHIDKDFVRKKGYNPKSIIENFLKHFEHTSDMQTKIDILTCLYKFKIVIPNWEEKLILSVIKKLKPGLKDRKRIVRKLCGVCINFWSMIE